MTSSDESERNLSGSELAAIFTDRTSLHGVKSIYYSPNWLIRGFWVLAFLAVSISCIYQIVMAFTVYLQFRTITDTTITVSGSCVNTRRWANAGLVLHWPASTRCRPSVECLKMFFFYFCLIPCILYMYKSLVYEI